MNLSTETDLAPKRQIAPWTTVEVVPGGGHVRITQHSEHHIDLDKEAVSLLIQWLDRAGFSESDETWPGIPAS